jgi:hypothetical protein
MNAACPRCAAQTADRAGVVVVTHAPSCPLPARWERVFYDGPQVCPYCHGPMVGEMERALDDGDEHPDLVRVIRWRCLADCQLGGEAS